MKSTTKQNAAAETKYADVSDFSSLLDKEFKPKTTEARDAVEAAVRTLAEQALVNAVTMSVEYSFDGRKALIDINAGSQPNPLNSEVLKGFRCPGRAS